ncbi:MAG: DNA adenine methylase [Flavobacteriaceae bacterium]|jgi:adenine-specific DNA-methyltransferase|nr:DNA adenine methylase [Flavobacteriaceae bacterium]
MRFIGNKENLVEKIYQKMIERNISGNSFFDFFAGTTNVGRFFKKKNFQVFSSDLLYFSYVLQKAYIANNQELNFEELLKGIDFKTQSLFSTPLQKIVDFLNQIPDKQGFIYENYTPAGNRMYYSEENGLRIDAIRLQIEDWKNTDLITENEYFVLLACLIETVPFYANVAGIYAAFQKKWDPRAVKKLILRPIEFVVNDKENFVCNVDSVSLINTVETDIFYLDPPYNQRQYAPNYHLMETIAKYDNPEIKGITGLRANYENEKSKFCNATTALQELKKVAEKGKYKTLILSYNNEGIMPETEILLLFGKIGTVELVEFDYLRFKSNNNGESKNKKHIKEQLYILRK